MKVIKPFVRDGVRFSRGDKAPTGLDKETVSHYVGLGLVEEGGTAASSAVAKPAAKTPSAPAPVRRPALPGPKETKPAAPLQTALVGAGTVAGLQDEPNDTTTVASADAAVAVAVAVAVADSVEASQGASLPLGPVGGVADMD